MATEIQSREGLTARLRFPSAPPGVYSPELVGGFQANEQKGAVDFIAKQEVSVIPLESFSRYPRLTALLSKKPKLRYGVIEFCEGIGLSKNMAPKVKEITVQVYASHGIEVERDGLKVPYDYASEVFKQASRRIDFVRSEAMKRAKSHDPKTSYSLHDAVCELGYQDHSSRLSRRIRQAAAMEGVNGAYDKYMEMNEDEFKRVCDRLGSATPGRSERGKKSWESRRANQEVLREQEIIHQEKVETNKATLTSLFETQHGRLVRYVAVRIGNLDEAEDLVSDVFVNALRKIGSYKNRGVPMEVWLLRGHPLVT